MSTWFENEKLHFAAADGDLEKVRELVEEGFEVNAFDEVGAFDVEARDKADAGHSAIQRASLARLCGAGASAFHPSSTDEANGTCPPKT